MLKRSTPVRRRGTHCLPTNIQGRLLHINDGANAPWKKVGGSVFAET